MNSFSLSTPIQYLKGVGPKLGAILIEKNIHTIEDLLMIFPRAYEDQRSVKTVEEFVENELVVTTVQVVQVNHRRLRGRRRMLEWVCNDDTGMTKVVFFRILPAVHLSVKSGATLRLIGKPTLRGRTWQMVHPQFRIVEEDLVETSEGASISPIYPEVGPLTQNKWRRLVQTALEKVTFKETVFPPSLLQRLKLPFIDDAIRFLHNPPNDVEIDLLQEGRHPNYLRFVFEEFFLYELSLLLNHDQNKKVKSFSIPEKSKLYNDLMKQLPFELTSDQKTVVEKLSMEMSTGDRVYSLIQGDVGSGKTIVALLLAMKAVDAGFQTAFMAPTELLAEQHLQTIKTLLSNIPVEVDLLTGSMNPKQKEIVLENFKTGRTQIAIGTHALIQKSVDLPNLGLAIIDEQHRFGVEQRLRLSQKGRSPHQIHMTATPIPRTLALTIFGDMDVYTIREKPKGRLPIRTKWVYQKRRDGVYDFVRQECKKGHQAYVVYPLIEESETLNLKNATDEFELLKNRFPDLKMELIHGRLNAIERDQAMRAFVAGDLDILVSTTVIEVGVDVPNATIMVIENAERFGLSQLHQLRGRVGRGSTESWCILVSGYGVTEDGELRLQIMQQTNDGFVISEKDLEMRGPGEFIGSKQSGLPGFKYADILKHQEILTEARQLARKVLDEGNKELIDPLQDQARKFYGEKLHLLDA